MENKINGKCKICGEPNTFGGYSTIVATGHRTYYYNCDRSDKGCLQNG